MSRFSSNLAARPALLVACAAALSFAAVVAAQEHAPKRAGPPILFSAPLADVPGKHLVVVALNAPPHSGPPSTREHHRRGHHHPGSVYIYVTQGALRLGLKGQPVQVVKAGGSFFEPVGADHVITENASATEPARAIAVMIVPDGKPLVTRDKEK